MSFSDEQNGLLSERDSMADWTQQEKRCRHREAYTEACCHIVSAQVALRQAAKALGRSHPHPMRVSLGTTRRKQYTIRCYAEVLQQLHSSVRDDLNYIRAD